MYSNEEYKLEAEEDEQHKFGFSQSAISKEIEQIFGVSDYSVEGSVRYIDKMAVKNNRFWIYTKDSQLYTMKFGGIPEDINISKFKDHSILFIRPDEKGEH